MTPSTNTVPGSAADWVRAAVLTRSPTTSPSPGLSIDAARPVTIPARARSSGTPTVLPERAHRLDQLEPRPDGPLGVVLARHGCAPDGHDRVADELLERAAVARR